MDFKVYSGETYILMVLNSLLRDYSPFPDVGLMILKSLGRHDSRTQPPRNAADREAFIKSVGVLPPVFTLCALTFSWPGKEVFAANDWPVQGLTHPTVSGYYETRGRTRFLFL